MKILFLILAIITSVLFAETRVKIYRIPLGTYLKVQNEDDIGELTKKIDSTEPTIEYLKKSKDKMFEYKGMKIYLKDNTNKKENYNKLLEVIADFSKEIPELDQEVIKKTLFRLKAQ